ncbi:MAG TPA: N-acetylmuramoyl-L-alanine amidase [Thermoanaerobaculia bacterium]|nr:N-acetylmuramoyl-L-alanine amidase [Thermoanaerobaculia bacterium]
MKVWVLAVLAALLTVPMAGAAPDPKHAIPRSLRMDLGGGLVATLTEKDGIFLEAVPQRGEGLLAFTRRLCGDSRLSPQILEANGSAGSTTLIAGMRYRIPFDLLSQEWHLKLVKTLFPKDSGQADGWKHEAHGIGAMQRESLWQISLWYTGTGENFRAIREYNELMDDDVPRGTAVVIPSELLRPAFKAVLPVPEKPYHLTYGKDGDGEYAVYRLRPGEALYSSVVVRFTGRVHAQDVNQLASEIAGRSGVVDVTDIPIGYRVKIPFDVLQPEFLPEGHPRRLEYEASLRASAQFSNQVKARGLAGITVVLDAGHGGQDPGASMGGVWESTYVYDIALRVKRLLETQTAAKVVVTTRDGADFKVQEADVLPFSRRHSVLTTPPYPIEDARVGTNLRWYLANSVYRKTVKESKDPQKVVFISIHADSLHPSLRGAMAYIPSAEKRDGTYGKSGTVYTSRKEVQEDQHVSFPWQQRVESEGLSRELAKEVIAAFHANGLPVHPFKPVRDKIIRNKSAWVPAVLRYNSVPAKMLLEVCNLANDQDRRLIQTRAWRQKVSEAVVKGLLAYYGEEQGGAGPAVKTAK